MLNVKDVIKNILYIKSTMTSDEIIKKISHYNNISFDLFDTLVKRNVSAPKDIFRQVALKYNSKHQLEIDPVQFQEDRINAYKMALSKAKEDNRAEITIDEIYYYLTDDYIDFEELKRLEILLEIDLCHTDPTMKRVFEWCLQNKKKVFIISDMYLDVIVIEKLLHKCGYNNYQRLYLSSQENMKKANGQLYDLVIEENGLFPSEIIHVGDNPYSDFYQAYKKHISSLLIANNPYRTKFTRIMCGKESGNNMQVLRTILNSFYDVNWNDYYKYGFEVLGPLLFGFAKWLHNRALEDKVDKLLFLSRDGMLLQNVYNVLYGTESITNSYIYVSRNSLTRALIWNQSELSNMLQGSSRKNWTCETFCNRLGIDVDRGERTWKNCGLDINTRYTTDELISNKNVQKFYEIFKDEVICNSKMQFSTVRIYLKQVLGPKTGLVDIGWAGTTQKAINTIIEISDMDISTHGYYISTNKTLMDGISISSFVPRSENMATYTGGLIEFPFTTKEGSTNSYEVNQGKAEPILKDNEYSVLGIDKEPKIIKEIQKGAVEFVNNIREIRDLYEMPWQTAYYNMKMVSKSPRLFETQLFGELLFYNDNFLKLASPKKKTYYFSHPKALIKDIKTAGWKHGFLKRLLVLPLPYDKIITFMSRGK